MQQTCLQSGRILNCQRKTQNSFFTVAEREAPQLGAGVTSVTRVKEPVIGLGAVEHADAAADWCFEPFAWLDSAASPMFKMSNHLRHSVPFARPGS